MNLKLIDYLATPGFTRTIIIIGCHGALPL